MLYPVSLGDTITSQYVTSHSIQTFHDVCEFLESKIVRSEIPKSLYRELTKSEQIDLKKRLPYWSGTLYRHGQRNQKNAFSRTLFTGDADTAPPDWKKKLSSRLKSLPYLVHTSASHDPVEGKYKIRIVIPLNEEINHPGRYQAVAKQLMQLINGDDPEWFDTGATKDMSRGLFLPLKFKDDEAFELLYKNSHNVPFNISDISEEDLYKNLPLPDHVNEQEVHDEFFEWLADNGKLLSSIQSNGSYRIRCPLEQEHSNGDETGAFYYPLGKGDNPRLRTGGCQHHHMGEKVDSSMLLALYELQGAPKCDVKGPIELFETESAGLVREMITSRLHMLVPMDLERLAIDTDKIDRILNSTFIKGDTAKIHTLMPNDIINQYSKLDAIKYLLNPYGAVLNMAYFRELVESYADIEGGTTTQRQKIIRNLLKIPVDAIIDYAMQHNQRLRMEIETDIFAEHSTMELLPDSVKVKYRHMPYPEGIIDEEIISDYQEHFAEVDDFIDFLVANRFARDRKQSYLWFYCSSDWGKGFIIGILNELNAAVSFNVREVEKIFEGNPIGKSKEMFRFSIACIFDEFKFVKSELKELQSKITLSPKHQLSCTVDIYSKLFFSAENVASLAGSRGVEDQFANRMSLFRKQGSIVERQKYLEVGNYRYFESVKNYFAKHLNEGIEEWKKKGPIRAADDAEEFLADFMSKYGLDTQHERLSGSLVKIAEDFRHDALEFFHDQDPKSYFYGKVITDTKGNVYLRSPLSAYENWCKDTHGLSEGRTYIRLWDQVRDMVAVDKKGYILRKIPRGNDSQRTIKTLKIMSNEQIDENNSKKFK